MGNRRKGAKFAPFLLPVFKQSKLYSINKNK